MMYDVTKQEALFDRFKLLGGRLSDMGAIVQNNLNDFPVSPTDVDQFEDGMYSLIDQVNHLFNDTYRFLVGVAA